MSKKIGEMTSERVQRKVVCKHDYYAKHYFNINDFVKAVDYLREDGLSFAHIAKISGMTHKSLMQFYYRDQIEPHARTKGKANFLIDFVSTVKKLGTETIPGRYKNAKS